MKIRVYEDFRVIVIPQEPWFLEDENMGMTEKNLEKWRDACKRIIEEIRRHIDGLRDVFEEFDAKDVCSFCRSEWEEENGCPVCCRKAVEEWEVNHDKNT